MIEREAQSQHALQLQQEGSPRDVAQELADQFQPEVLFRALILARRSLRKRAEEDGR